MGGGSQFCATESSTLRARVATEFSIQLMNTAKLRQVIKCAGGMTDMHVSLTELVDVVLKAGSPKATQVAQIKARSLENYKPFKDFYKSLRDALIETHRNGGSRDFLSARISHVREPNRRRRYDELVAHYKRWWGRKDMAWFTPPSATYTSSGVSVSVNPEIGLEFGGDRYVIKLYFKADQLKKSSADLITGLMASALSGQGDEKFGVLDVERGKLYFRQDQPPDVLVAMIDAELAYIAQLWPALGDAA